LIENNAAYIQDWVKVLKDKPEILVESSRQAQKAFDYIIGNQKIINTSESD
jgi:antirestriction protein ArdC